VEQWSCLAVSECLLLGGLDSSIILSEMLLQSAAAVEAQMKQSQSISTADPGWQVGIVSEHILLCLECFLDRVLLSEVE
jgi:hypothetical protein